MGKHILLVDDDAFFRRGLAFSLNQSGFQTTTAATAEEALSASRANPPDLVLLDIGLPGMDGLEALRQFQREQDIPVIFLTARRRELDEILGMEMGADDYITKPFNLDVLLGHVKAVLRRSASLKGRPPTRKPVRAGALFIDPLAHQVSIGGKPISLTPREFDLLYCLALEVGHVVPVEKLLAEIWGAEFSQDVQVVYVHIRLLREKIERLSSNSAHIITVRGIGYKLIAGSGPGDRLL